MDLAELKNINLEQPSEGRDKSTFLVKPISSLKFFEFIFAFREAKWINKSTLD